MDDPTLADLYGTNNPALQGYKFTGTESPVIAALRAKLTPEQMQNLQAGAIGPGGTSPIGTALAWTPYDPNQQLFDSHQHYGDTVDDPVYGKLQSMWTEPRKSQHDVDRWMPVIFGAALAAISGGAAAPLLGTLFSAATQYGSTGKLNPTQLALQTAAGYAPGVLSSISPELAQGFNVASKAYGIGNAGYQATRDNYDPAINLAGNAALGQIFSRGA
jgi:hypothetical protein